MTYEVMLRELDENLVKATSAKQALGMLLQMDSSVVLLDVNMLLLDEVGLASALHC